MTLSTFDAKSVLASEEAVSSQLPSTEVDLGVEPDVVCLGNLLLVESNPRDEDVGNDADKLRDIARDNAQILLNSLWRLPTHRVEEALVAALPPPKTQLVVLPREKPAPKPRQPTKWEKFAAEKGIVMKKKTKLVWDDEVRRFVPRFGYGKAKADGEKNWLMEIKVGSIRLLMLQIRVTLSRPLSSVDMSCLFSFRILTRRKI